MSSNNKFGTIIQIGDILVSEDVVTEYFACDYAVCKGCCCIIGDSGAPLEESELEPLEENYPIYSKLMRPQGRAQIDKEGFFSIDRDGDIVTPVVDQTRNAPTPLSTRPATVSAPSNGASSKASASSANPSPAGSTRSASPNSPAAARP